MQGVIVRRHDSNDDLQDAEIDFINQRQGTCPQCRQGELIGGPRGGLNQCFRCSLCGAEFNLTLYPKSEQFVISGHRLARDEPAFYGLAALRLRWGRLDDSPPPGISAQDWKAFEAKALEAANNPDRE